MYNDNEKQQLMNDLVEMETFKADVGDEGKILQNDLKEYFINGKGDKEDLIFRLEYYLYAFKLFCRRSVKIDRNQFIVYLNDSLLDYHLINLVATKKPKISSGVIMREFKDIDYLIDGPFILEERDITLAMRGSRNQRILDMKELRNNEH